MRTTFSLISVLGLFTVFLAGCTSTPRGLQHVPTAPRIVVDSAQSPREQAFAFEAGKLSEGSSAVLQTTPLGSAKVSIVSIYVNALGESCLRAEVANKTSAVLCGVCLGKDGIWRYVPPNL